MNFDLWFEKQSLVVKIILIILPFVGWIMEILVRLSAYLRNKNDVDLIIFIIFLLLGATWIPLIIDVIFLCMKGRLFCAEDLSNEVKGTKVEENKEDNKEDEKKD